MAHDLLIRTQGAPHKTNAGPDTSIMISVYQMPGSQLPGPVLLTGDGAALRIPTALAGVANKYKLVFHCALWDFGSYD